MSSYPIIFGLRDYIQGNDFLAVVAVEGRALLHEEEEGGAWVEGVNPGGFVATGNSVAEALEEFRRSYTAILFDIAEDAETFESFREQCTRFFEGSAEITAREWEQAVEDVRAGRISADWLGRRSAESPRGIAVARMDRPSVQNNRVEEGAALAA
jgi:predicted RNase H-like HicB family nuclease